MKNIKNKHAISLIVLVITIIIMIILAGAIILSLGNSGIIDKASGTVEDTNIATVKELAQLGWADAYAKAKMDGIKANSSDMLKALKAGVNNILSKNGIDKNEYKIEVTTKGVEIQKENGWIQKGLTVKKGNEVLEIGDIVHYNEQVADYTGGWKVLGAEDGHILIMSTEDVNKDEFSEMFGGITLSGEEEYIDGINTLDDICKVYKIDNIAVEARSITVEDINKVTGYVPETAGYGRGAAHEYGNDVTFMWNGSNSPYYTSTNGARGNLEFSSTARYFLYFKGLKFIESLRDNSATEDAPVKIDTLKMEAYTYYPTTLTENSTGQPIGLLPNSEAYKMLFESGDYWLASRCTGLGEYYYHSVHSNKVDLWKVMLWTGGVGLEQLGGVRAVVKLASNVELTPHSTTGWNIE